ncbi:MAG: DUF6077 domain-containing protein [Clostridiales bacterium]|nr:DUF6077 domain-containing protein [Clostridiales bacterium]
MEIRNGLVLCLWLVILPSFIGSIWCHFATMTGNIKKLLFCWVSGFLTVMAASQLILVPLTLRRYSFTSYRMWAAAVYLLLIILAAFLLWRRRRVGRSLFERGTAEGQVQKWNVWQILFFCGAVLLIVAQAFVAAYFEHIDDDDSRFVVLQNLAVDYDSMYKQHPVTGDMVYWNMGELRKDMLSPWAMFLALISRLSGIAPAVLSHKYLPFFLILLCYAVYALLALYFWPKDREKVGMFLIFVGALNLFGYFSTHTTQAVFLLRIWQGKAFVGAMLIPAMSYLLLEVMRREKEKLWYALAAVCSTAAALASGTGITLLPLLVAAFGGAEWIHTRRIKRAALIWVTALPSVGYLLCYLFFWKLVKIYY